MPLIKSGSRAAVSKNISEMVHAGHPQNQAVAAALRNARQYKASGGASVPTSDRHAIRHILHEGFLNSDVPGRTDKLPIAVQGGAYVLPADHVAALGQGNSIAGANFVNKMFKMGPYGMPTGGVHSAKANVPHLHMKTHGGVHRHTTPIVAAGGEIVIPPHKIIERFGDLSHGHKALDAWVKRTRKKHIKTLRNLKPPRKD